MFKDFKHSIPIQIRFVDIDRLNHVNNATYLNYMELGRVHYFNSVLKNNIDWIETGLILARTEIDYKIPVLLKDEIFCYSRVSKFGTKSLVMNSTIVKKENGVLVECAAGVFTLVAMNYITNASIAIPDAWREIITDFEK